MRILRRAIVSIGIVTMVCAVAMDVHAGGKGGHGAVKGHARKDAGSAAPHSHTLPDTSIPNDHLAPGYHNRGKVSKTPIDAEKMLDHDHEHRGGFGPMP
jgi:hypothetical protein